MNLNLTSSIQEKTLIFTVTSDGYKYFTWNLFLYCQRANLPVPLCILCLDRESHEFFTRIAMIPSRLFLLEGPHLEHKQPALFGTTPFKRMNRMKLKALQELSQRSDIETLLFLDSDIAVFRNPLPELKPLFDQSPLWFQCDEAAEGKFECSNPESCTNACTGVIAMHLTEESRPAFFKLYSIDETWKAATTDQDYINARLKALPFVAKTLPRTTFPNGIFLRESRYKEGTPVLLHFNHIVGLDKKRFMKKEQCWLLTV